MSETEIKILIAVGSAFLGYTLGWLKDQWELRRRRRALATAVLLDLRDIEESLQELLDNTDSPAEGILVSTTDIRSKFFQELTLFQPHTVAAVQDVYSFVAATEMVLTEHAHGRMGTVANANWAAQLQASYAAGCIGLAKKRLEKEGGVLPPQKGLVRCEPPQLPPRPVRQFGKRTR